MTHAWLIPLGNIALIFGPLVAFVLLDLLTGGDDPSSASETGNHQVGTQPLASLNSSSPK